MPLYLLDTNTVIFIINGRSPAARARLASLRRNNNHSAGVSSTTAGEILFVLARLECKRDGQRKRKAIDQLFSALPLHPWGRATAEVHGRLREQQGSMEKPLGPFDTQIAAHALQLAATVVSHRRDFRRVAGLPVEDWATDL